MHDTAVIENANEPGSQRPAPAVAQRDSVDVPAQIERNRRRGLERIIEFSRWAIILVAFLYTDFPGANAPHATVTNLIIGIWAFLNIGMTTAVLTNHYPSKSIQTAWLALDIIFASAICYQSGGFHSPYAVIMYVVILMGSLRLGILESMAAVIAISIAYLIIGSTLVGSFTVDSMKSASSTILLFIIVAAITQFLSRELVATHDEHVKHSFALEKTALEELRDIEHAKGEFMMLASHELRTPLTKIKGWLSLMQEAGDRLPPGAREEAMNELRIETEHLARLTDNLLSISQLQTGEIRLRTSSVDLESCFRDVLGRFVESVNKQRFRFELDAEAPRVLADHDRLILALACLIDNALKFSPEDESIDIRTEKSGRYVRIEITDHGRRIPDSDVDRVFASFYQVESPLVRQRGGFGVGLYLSRQLIEHMGGTIGLDNTRGARGNTFYIQLKAQV